MKKLFNIILIAALGLSLAACGSSKKLADVTGAQKLDLDPAQEYAMLRPARRAVGTGTHFKESTARNLAEADARAQLARTVQAEIATAVKDYTGDVSQFVSDMSESQALSDQESSAAALIQSVTQNIDIVGAVVVKMSRYYTKDKQYQYYVCVEYDEDAGAIAAKATKTFNEKLSADQKAKIKFNEAEFEKKIAERFNN